MFIDKKTRVRRVGWREMLEFCYSYGAIGENIPVFVILR